MLFRTWHSIFVTDKNSALDFHFSLCRPMKGVCTDQAICFMDAEGGTVQAGKFELPPKSIETISQHEFAVNYTGGSCPGSEKPRIVTIIFSCGKTLVRVVSLVTHLVTQSI